MRQNRPVDRRGFGDRYQRLGGVRRDIGWNPSPEKSSALWRSRNVAGNNRWGPPGRSSQCLLLAGCCPSPPFGPEPAVSAPLNVSKRPIAVLHRLLMYSVRILYTDPPEWWMRKAGPDPFRSYTRRFCTVSGSVRLPRGKGRRQQLVADPRQTSTDCSRRNRGVDAGITLVSAFFLHFFVECF
jgi:hypothetical protein